MNQHANVLAFRKPIEALDRSEIVKSMAEHLVAAILHGRLDTSSDIDVIETLRVVPERFHHRVILDHMDDALYSAKQMLIAREMGEG